MREFNKAYFAFFEFFSLNFPGTPVPRIKMLPSSGNKGGTSRMKGL